MRREVPSSKRKRRPRDGHDDDDPARAVPGDASAESSDHFLERIADAVTPLFDGDAPPTDEVDDETDGHT